MSVSTSSQAPLSLDSGVEQSLTTNLQRLVSLGTGKDSGSAYQNNGDFATALNNVVEMSQKGLENSFAPNSHTNGTGSSFLSAMENQMSQFQTGLTSGSGNVPGIVSMAKDALTAMGESDGTQAATGTGAGGTGAGGASSGGVTGTGATVGAPVGALNGGGSAAGGGTAAGFQQVQTDLGNEASAQDVGGKATALHSAITDLISTINGGGAAGGGGSTGGAGSTGTTSGTGTDSTAGSGSGGVSPSGGSAISPGLATKLLNGLDNLSQIAQSSGASGKLQDGIAGLVGMIDQGAQGSGGSGAASGAGSSSPALGSGSNTSTGSSGAQPNVVTSTDDVTKHYQAMVPDQVKPLVPILGELANLVSALKPALSQAPGGGQVMDSLSEVVSELAQIIKGAMQQQPASASSLAA